ncbi:MAG: phosphodiesterase [Oscillospiraceae bacterium]|nr:phosphodiesterase [Oscillospiraceae bacterium]
MKWLIASDIHGSAFYCRRLLEAYARENADKMLLLGDILYHGPRNDLPKDYQPKEVIAMLNPLAAEILCVRGNCDGEVDQMVLDFPIMAEYALLADDKTMIFATHGHHFHAKQLPPLQPGDILLHGHTHVPVCMPCGEHDAFSLLNPGSVSIPKEASPHSYMTFENHVFQWKTLSGEVYRTWKIGDAYPL